MAGVVRIADTTGGVFLHPTDVFAALGPEAHELDWAILDLPEAFAPDGSDLDLLSIERQVEESPNGLHLTFAELQRFATALQQVIDGLFVGNRPGHGFPSRDQSDAALIAEAEVMVAAVDSSFWLVSGPSKMLDRIRARFADVADVDPSEVTLSAWGR
jgi:hypothetical protein